ncbi:MAG: D-alanyl-D-alanine carboxypeptidase/D-alanyl-D-alanine-endopeptidase [Myxococcota bacterium]|nr:D-alanyl-D-alanine carboxypeptidase/D-alanyl-D-alanine-endopeptidase [Myxococcota bacterium]
MNQSQCVFKYSRQPIPIFLNIVGLLLILWSAKLSAEHPKPAIVAESGSSYKLENTPAARRLRTRVKRILRRGRLAGVRVGIVIADAKTGIELVRIRPNSYFNPASTLKLFTAAAALHSLDKNRRFTTELLADSGTLTLRGTGDPVFFTKHLRAMLRTAMPAIRNEQIQRVTVDTTAFAGSVLAPGFGKKNTDASYRAATGAVALNYGSVQITLRPNRVGERPRVNFEPPGRYVVFHNRATTVPGKGSTLTLRLTKQDMRSAANLSGRLGQRQQSVAFRRRVEHPPLAAGFTLRELLERNGIRIRQNATLAKASQNARSIVQHTSKPLHKILADMNKHSNNFIAEMVLRAISMTKDKPATWERSTTRVHRFLRETIGINGFEYYNGSGLYDGGRFSPRQVVKLLVHMNSSADREAFRNSLAVAGRPGTLEYRLPKYALKVIGKTGTLNQASALSGYARSRSGRLLAFSILMNKTKKATARMRKIQDQIAAALVDINL